MRLKSILSAFILLFVLVAVISITVKKLLIAPSADSSTRVDPTATLNASSADNQPEQALLAAQSVAKAPASPLPTATLPHAASVDGLSLQLCRPLMFDVDTVCGLAVTDDSFFVASVNDTNRVGMLIQVSREHYGVVQMRAMQQDNRFRLGGLHMGPDGLWVPLAGDGDDTGSTIALVDPNYLDVVRSFQVADRIRAVAQGADGYVVGVNEAGDRFYAWDAEGRELRQVANLTSTRYYDLAVLRGSLLCAGETADGRTAVLDVLEPSSLTRVARHRADARTTSKQWITLGGFDAYDEQFFFLPEGGSRPMLLTYVLNQVTLEEYVPSIQR